MIIIGAGTTLESNSFNFSWNTTIYFGFQLKLKELLTSVVPAWVILTILIIIRPKKNICVFPVTRPTLIFPSDPKVFIGIPKI